ncbi:cytochrome P450 [Streptomyces sp. IB2014 016-6]|uniref:cytochrome P450 n=1 Tax=Streptomyces sp. IB2014 016-6 TaxID=2517818 RepID=UPI0011C7768C|nr:cytochrome P450 [Streptomyces sp. IB2014 016-6]TXL89517.1 cytochrome P450 [Streptomyces sp. IB2014 016-6]
MTTSRYVPPIAPGKLPLIGHAVPLIKDRLAFIQSLRAHGPIVRITVGPKTMTVVNSTELIHKMLTSQSDEFTKGLLFEKLKLFGKDALPVAEGKPHLRRRRMMQPAFHREQIAGYVTTMRETVQPYIAGWDGGTPIDMKTEMQLMTQGVVMSALFSAAPRREPAHTILNSVDTVFRTALQRALLPISALERLPTRRNRKARDAGSALRTAVAEIIAEHRANPGAYDDVVSLLLTARDETGAALPDDEILSEVTGLLAAGSETTAVVLAWLFHELGRNPDLERRLHEEVDPVLAEGPITADRVPRLAFTRRLVSETLRLYSPAWLVTRQAISDVRLGEFSLPAGTDVIWSAYALHRDPDLYPDPLRFDPDRWLPERPQPPKGAFIPFGSGKRMCMGDAFAWTEATIITAMVASRWRLRPTPGTVRPVGAITTHPSSLHMVPELRHHAVTGKAR